MSQGRFYPWWVECWGGCRIWTICDREPRHKTHPHLPQNIKTEIGAKRLAARMNADWERYCNAIQRRAA